MEKFTSLHKLEYVLGIEREILRDVAANVSIYYKPFNKVKGSKKRHIDNPTGKLKLIQSRLDKRILKNIQLPPTILGGVSKKDTRINALFHSGKKYVVTLDLKNCFPSTSDTRIFQVFKNMGYSTKLSSLLTRLTTYDGYLPQGSPSSTSLLNLVMLPLHDEIQELIKKDNITCTFWVDDITFSGNFPQKYLGEIIPKIQKFGYSIRRKKVKIMPRYKQQITTGLLVNNFPGVPRQKLKEYRKQIVKQEIGSISAQGKAQYALHINKHQGRKLTKLIEMN